MEFTSYNFGGSFYSATVKNTIKGIEISNLKSRQNAHIPSRPYQIIEELLSPMKPPYSKIDVSTKEGKKELKGHCLDKIEKLKLEIKEYEMAAKMCTRNLAYFKEL